MIDRSHDLPVQRQAKVLTLARSTVYYKPRPVSAEDLALMRRLDELHLDYPFAGARMLRLLLQREGTRVGRRRIATVMKRMGIQALYRRPNTSKPELGHKNLSVSAARGEDRTAEPRLGDGPDLYPDGARLLLSGRRHRLVHPQGARLAAVDHHGCSLLY